MVSGFRHYPGSNPILAPGDVSAIQSKKGTIGRRVFWDVEHREQEPYSRPLIGDERLCATILITAIRDFTGASDYAEDECIDCHKKNHPRCYTDCTRNGELFTTRHDRGCTDFHTYRQCAERWLYSDEEQPVGPLVDGKRQFISEGWTFITICDFLSLEPTFVRRCLNRKDCQEYWADEAKVNSMLGFFVGQKTSDDAGHSDQAGDDN
jgi:hypothetical protein